MEHSTGFEPALVVIPFPVTFLSVRSGGGYECIIGGADQIQTDTSRICSPAH
jgi:hypothetical protein